MILKLEKHQLHNSFFLDSIAELVHRLLFQWYGAFGSEEFEPIGYKLRQRSNTWRVVIRRRIDALTIDYELIIDNFTGDVIGFRRLTFS